MNTEFQAVSVSETLTRRVIEQSRARSTARSRHLSALRKFALSLLRQDKHYPKRSLRGRRKTAARLPDYRASLLGLAT